MRSHTVVINHYIQKVKAKSYLEIGVRQNDANFNKIKCANKIGVDPDPEARATCRMTSDQFFANTSAIFDLVFADGLHHADQLERDIINSSKHLSKNGVIICHDVNPKEEDHAVIPRGDRKIWNGDVWRTFVGLKQKYPRLKIYCYKEDHGVGIIFPAGTVFEAPFVSDITWEEFNKNKRRLLNLI